MPHATNAYPFEAKVFAWANTFAARMTGDNARAFLAILAPDGSTAKVIFSERPAFDHALMEDLTREAPGFIFYDPFDFPVYGFLSWKGVGQAAMERLIGSTFVPEDFVPWVARGPGKAGPVPYPSEWDVMF